jgi:hypothetical protein
MKMKWLATTAIAVMFGTGALLAQQPEQKREEKTAPRAQMPEQKEPARPAAGEQMKGRTTGQAQEKAGPSEPRQAETPSPAERGKQAQEPLGRESREPTRQSQEQPARGERTPSTAQEEPKGRDVRQSTEQQRGRESQKDERVEDTKRPADNKQTTEQDRAREGQKEERAQDSSRPGETKQQQSQQERDRNDQMSRQRQGENAGQAEARTNRRSEINDDQRRQIVDRLQREKTAFRENVNLRVNVGERLPPRVEARRLPPDIVRIAPQYRDYEYTVIDNRIAIVDPRSREVVDFIDEGPDYGRTASYDSDRVVISDDVRTSLKQLARNSSNTVGSSSGGSTCLSLQPVPEDMVRSHPELSSYRYLSIGDEVVLVDPQKRKVVQVID